MEFAPVLVSSPSYVERLAEVITANFGIRQLTGAYRVPSGFPYVQSGWMRTPVPMYATGELRIEYGSMHFGPKPLKSTWPAGLHNVRLDFQFDLAADDVISIGFYDVPPPVIQPAEMPFIRIRTTREGDLGDLLVCVGGQTPFTGGIARANADLADAMRASFPGAARLLERAGRDN